MMATPEYNEIEIPEEACVDFAATQRLFEAINQTLTQHIGQTPMVANDVVIALIGHLLGVAQSVERQQPETIQRDSLYVRKLFAHQAVTILTGMNVSFVDPLEIASAQRVAGKTIH